MKTLLGLSALLWAAIAPLASAGSATWSANPTTSDWSVASNWTPASVPDGPHDVASFGVSSLPQVDLYQASSGGQLLELVSSIHFNPGASAFTVTSHSFGGVSMMGEGVINQSGIVQNFDNAAVPGQLGVAAVNFYASASAGDLITYTNGQGTDSGTGICDFFDDSTAGTATFIDQGGSASFAMGGKVEFYDQSSASGASFFNEGASDMASFGGFISFNDNATAAQGNFVNNGASNKGLGGEFFFFGNSSAGSAVITNNGGSVAGAGGGTIYLFSAADCGTATITNNGGTVAGAKGSLLFFTDTSSAHRAIIVANGGVNGGDGAQIILGGRTTARFAQFKIYGNALLDVSAHGRVVRIGSLEGDGNVVLGAQNLAVGLVNRDTVFSGLLMDGKISGGSLSKLGTKSLQLSSANTYTGGTTVSAGTLSVTNITGSATGTGAVAIDAGTLAGSGVIAGAVTIGTGSGSGATLAPANGKSDPATLTLQSSLTVATDGTYFAALNVSQSKADQVVGQGVTLASGAQFALQSIGNKKLPSGTVFTVISNTAGSEISGTFANLADGSTLTAGRNRLLVSYTGGDGNDLTLTVVP